MRRLVAVTLVVVGLMLLPTDAHAQGFWRWLEHLSGPDINGPGFDLVFQCRGVDLRRANQTGQTDVSPWFASPYCVDANRNRVWISIGVEVYALAGDNNQTREIDDDRVDLVGVMPFLDVNLPIGFAVGAGVGVRHYEAGAGPFDKAVIEGTIKWRPLRTFVRGGEREAPSIRLDLLELRLGFVYQGAFDAGQLGPGTPRLDGDVSPVLVFAFNLVR